MLLGRRRNAIQALLEVVAAAKKATLAERLPELSRDRLKELCGALGLDEGGREKALLVDRLLGTAASASVSASASASTGSAAGKASGARAGSAPAVVEVPVGDKLTIAQYNAVGARIDEAHAAAKAGLEGATLRAPPPAPIAYTLVRRAPVTGDATVPKLSKRSQTKNKIDRRRYAARGHHGGDQLGLLAAPLRARR